MGCPLLGYEWARRLREAVQVLREEGGGDGILSLEERVVCDESSSSTPTAQASAHHRSQPVTPWCLLLRTDRLSCGNPASYSPKTLPPDKMWCRMKILIEKWRRLVKGYTPPATCMLRDTNDSAVVSPSPHSVLEHMDWIEEWLMDHGGQTADDCGIGRDPAYSSDPQDRIYV